MNGEHLAPPPLMENNYKPSEDPSQTQKRNGFIHKATHFDPSSQCWP